MQEKEWRFEVRRGGKRGSGVMGQLVKESEVRVERVVSAVVEISKSSEQFVRWRERRW